MTRPVITLTTDFGEIDAYVATMKGVILGICPDASLVDVSHHVRPQAVAQAAYLLSTTTPYFPPRTVHLVVIDPGVGTARRAVAVATERALYVAPDNGVLTLALADDPPHHAVHLTNSRYHMPHTSATFHGRDVFAPVAAHLARGVPLADLGEGIEPATLRALDGTRVSLEGDGPWQVEVIHIDHFGNAITNVQIEDIVPAETQIAVRGRQGQTVPLCRTFGDVAPGKALAYRGSSGRLELAMRGGSAAKAMELNVGDTLLVVKDEKMMGAE